MICKPQFFRPFWQKFAQKKNVVVDMRIRNQPKTLTKRKKQIIFLEISFSLNFHFLWISIKTQIPLLVVVCI